MVNPGCHATHLHGSGAQRLVLGLLAVAWLFPAGAAPNASSVGLAVSALPPGNLWLDAEPVCVTGTAATATVAWRVTDSLQRAVDAGAAPVSADGRFTIAPRLTGPDYYQLTVCDGASTTVVMRPLLVVSPHDPRTIASSPFGVMTHFAQGWTNDFLAVLARAGLKNIRDEQWWAAVESTRDTFAFPAHFESYMAAAGSAGIEPLICLSFGNTNQVPDGGSWSVPHTPEQYAAYGRYCQEVLRHYGNQIHAVEIWNEYNGSFCSGPAEGRPEFYAGMLQVAYRAIKAVRPDVTVLGCATVHAPPDWIAAVIDNGMRQGGHPFMDAVSIHPYGGSPDTLSDDLRGLRAVVRAHAQRDLPVWVTENGWGVAQLTDSAPVHTREQQARFLVRAWLEQLAGGVAKMFWYVSRDYHAFKTMGVFGDIDAPEGRYAAHPTAAAYATLARALDGARFEERTVLDPGSVHVLRFASGTNETLALWSLTPAAVTVATRTPLTLTELCGRQVRLTPRSGKVFLGLTDVPVYLCGKPGAVAVTRGMAVDVRPAVALGEGIAFAIDGRGGALAQGSYTLEVAGAWTRQHQPRASVIVPSGAERGERWLPYCISREGATNAWGLARTVVTDPVRLQRSLEFTASNRLVAVVENTSTGRACTIRLAEVTVSGLRSGAPLSGLVVPPASSRRLEFDIAGLVPFTIHTAQVTVVTQDGARLEVKRLTGYHPLQHRTITVDGALGDWDGVPALDLAPAPYRKIKAAWEGTNDLSGSVQLCSDATHLYLAARVHDNIFSQTYSGWDAWKGDNLQLGLSPLAPWDSVEQGDQRQEIGLSLTAHGPECYRSAGAGSKGVLTNVTLVVRREGLETIYECAIPWSELPGLGPDKKTFGFGLFVNDNDGDGRRGYKEWGSIKSVGDMQALLQEHGK